MSSAVEEAVPKTMRERFEAVMGIVDPFCRDHLNGEYVILCRRMAAALCRKRPSPKGAAEGGKMRLVTEAP